MSALLLAAEGGGAAAGVTFVDMFSGGDVGGGDGDCKQKLMKLYETVEAFVCNAAAAAAVDSSAAAPPSSSALSCFIIDGMHELLMCANYIRTSDLPAP